MKPPSLPPHKCLTDAAQAQLAALAQQGSQLQAQEGERPRFRTPPAGAAARRSSSLWIFLVTTLTSAVILQPGRVSFAHCIAQVAPAALKRCAPG